MSHFLLAVLHEEWQDIDEILAPYDAELETKPRLKYMKEEAIRYARVNYEAYRDKPDEECWAMMADGYTTDEEENIYTTCNPQAKWDWYEIGGRWNGYLRVKGKRTDSARIADIDFGLDVEVYEKSLRFWDVAVEHKPARPAEKFFTIFKEDYYLEYYGDRETFARRRATFTTHAVITPDGEWHERGETGWFGCSSETPEEGANWDENYLERFIKNADPKLMLTIVDCHI